jgi:short-subunit dehydrogenase involved in D-alanine esterification of teichoic acids
MDKRNIFTVGGRSGIGLELTKVLNADHHEVCVGLKSNERMAQMLIHKDVKAS